MSRTPIATLIDFLGMRQSEVVEYLEAQGIAASEGSVKAWRRGLYRPPIDAERELVRLALALRGLIDEFPDGAPPVVLHIREVLIGYDQWWQENVSLEPFYSDEASVDDA